MKYRNQLLRKYNLQLFAEKGGESDGDTDAGDGDDDQEEQSEEDEQQTEEKLFTQKELDEAIKERLKRERKKNSKPQTKVTENNVETQNNSNDKLQALEAKLLCYEAGVAKNCVVDVVALAKAYMNEDTDFEDAIGQVLSKYPQFKNAEKSEVDIKGKTPNNKGKSKAASSKRQELENIINDPKSSLPDRVAARNELFKLESED